MQFRAMLHGSMIDNFQIIFIIFFLFMLQIKILCGWHSIFSIVLREEIQTNNFSQH